MSTSVCARVWERVTLRESERDVMWCRKPLERTARTCTLNYVVTFGNWCSVFILDVLLQPPDRLFLFSWLPAWTGFDFSSSSSLSFRTVLSPPVPFSILHFLPSPSTPLHPTRTPFCPEGPFVVRKLKVIISDLGKFFFLSLTYGRTYPDATAEMRLQSVTDLA